jgi:hypothetical protein
MQFIDGLPLSAVIHQLRGLEKKQACAERVEPPAAHQLPPHGAARTPGPAAEVTPLTGEGRRGRPYFRLADVVPGALKVYDLPELAGLVPPRPLTLRGMGNAAGKATT